MANRPRLCRSDHQPNMLEYIDTTLNDSFASRLKVQPTSTTTNIGPSVANGYDQFGNTIVDQYLLYILCQKLSPARTDSRTDHLYHSLHQLLLSNGKISKSFFEYSPPTLNRSNYASLFHNYTNFIWNEFDVEVLLELACFILKYRLRDIFTSAPTNRTTVNGSRQKIIGYFVEIIAIYYLSTSHREFFLHSRSTEMLFPYPSPMLSPVASVADKDTSTFSRFLREVYDNGEINFDLRQVKLLLQSDGYQFLNKKLENKKLGFVNFFDTVIRYQQETSCRTLKSLCRLTIKTHVKQFPNDVKHLALHPSLTDELLAYLTYDNKYAFESYV